MTQASPATSYHDRNVYILGAGFSVDGRIPVVDAFMNKMRDSTAWLAQEGRQREAQAVANVLKFRLEAAAAAYRVNVDVENVEQLFSLASASPGIYAKDVPLAIAATVNFAHRTAARKECQLYFSAEAPANSATAYLKRQNAGMCSRYDYYLGLMTGALDQPSKDSGNTIVSFNYDLLVEESLNRLGIAYDYGLRCPGVEFDATAQCTQTSDSPALKVLKLHGSVNWAAAEGEQQKVRVYGDYEAVLSANRSPLLVPPTWRKHFSELSAVWDDAVASLQTATRIIIIGYSMPSTDQHFKYLLAAGLQGNISLRTLLFVNPGLKELKGSFYEIFRQQYLERNVVEFLPCTAARYLMDQVLTAKMNRSMKPTLRGITFVNPDPGEMDFH
jgi:hypothetical protein